MTDIRDCTSRADHEHTDDELRELRRFAAERHWSDVEDFIRVHCSREAAHAYFKVRGARPSRRHYDHYAFKEDIFALHMTDPAELSRRVELEQEALDAYEKDEAEAAVRLELTTDELHTRHWGEHLSKDDIASWRQTIASMRAGIFIPRAVQIVFEASGVPVNADLTEFRYRRPA